MRKILTYALPGLTLGSGCALPSAAQTVKNKESKPNIVIIYTDDMGVGDVSFLNNGWVETPNLDKLAKQGLVIESYYSSAPVSSPSRAGLTTGVYPLQLGMNVYLQTREGNAKCEQFDFLDPSFPSMARTFRSGGYATGHFGKWHMGGGRDVQNAPSIKEYGFDEYVSTWESPDPDPLITGSPDWIWSGEDSIKRWDRTAYFVDKALDFLSRNAGKPCFVNLWPDDMHTPWVPDKDASDHENNFETPPNFTAVLKEYDRQIGRFMDELTNLGLRNNTIVIFTSDNGPAPSFERKRTNNLRGVKCTLYEGGIKMPFIISWPNGIEAGKVDKTSVVTALDLFPSLCAMTGVELPADDRFSGEDMSRALLGESQQRCKAMMWDFGRNPHFNFPLDITKRSPSLCIRDGKWKLLMNPNGSYLELYDMSKDVYETTNLAEQNPEVAEEMKNRLAGWWETRLIPGRL